MLGQNQITTEMDAYAFSIVCIEILTMGRLPWPYMDDDAVRHFVLSMLSVVINLFPILTFFALLEDNTRPAIPNAMPFTTPALRDLLRVCWDVNPFARPAFSEIVRRLKEMRNTAGQTPDEVSPGPVPPLDLEEDRSRPSPDMRPIALPAGTPRESTQDVHSSSSLHHSLSAQQGGAGILLGISPDSSNASYRTAREPSTSPAQISHLSHREDTVGNRIHMPEPVFYTPSGPSSRASSLFARTPTNRSEEDLNLPEYDGYQSPPPVDDRLADVKNERRYRMVLTHEFHPSCTRSHFFHKLL